jgi:hypothetical protein
MSELLELGLLVLGLFLGVVLFSNIALPLVYGLPRASYWATRGWVIWRAPFLYLVAPASWVVVIALMTWGIQALSPDAANYLRTSWGLSTGVGVGVVITVLRAVFSRSSHADMNEDFVAFVRPYLTDKGAAAAGFNELGDSSRSAVELAGTARTVSRPGKVEHERLELAMDFDLQLGMGAAAVRWQSLTPHPFLQDSLARIALVALLYGRTLHTHAPTRGELFQRVEKAAKMLLEGSTTFELDNWNIRAGGLSFTIWPWLIVSPEEVTKAKTYVATLLSVPSDKLALDLHMAFGQEKVLAPSAPMIALFTVSQELDQQHRRKLGATLLAMNAYYGSPEAAGKGMRSREQEAFQAALPNLLA